MSDSSKKIVVEVISASIDESDGGGDVLLRVDSEDLSIFGALLTHEVEVVVEFEKPVRKKRAKVLKLTSSTPFEEE